MKLFILKQIRLVSVVRFLEDSINFIQLNLPFKHFCINDFNPRTNTEFKKRSFFAVIVPLMLKFVRLSVQWVN